MEGFNGELALVQFSSPVLSAHTSMTSLYSPNPDLKISGTIYTTDMEYFTSTPLAFTTISTQSHDSIWASPGWSEVFMSESTANTSSVFKDSSQIIVIATNMAKATENTSLGPTARTAERSLRSSNRELFRTTSSSEQISQSVHPVQIAHTEDDALVIGGVGIIETLVSSEVSSSVVTLTAFKTIVLTTVSTSMICTLPSITLSPTTLMTSRSTVSAFNPSSPTTYLSTFSSNSTTKLLTTQLSTFSSPLSISTAVTSTSSDISSISTLATSTIQLPVIPPTSSTATSITNSQPSVTPIDPPADPVCNAPPGIRSYIDVHSSDVNGHITTFCQTDFGEDCPTKGYAFEQGMDWDNSVVGYNISVNPIPFCSVLSTSTCEYPLPNTAFNCSNNLWTAWRNCWHNNGMGGSVSAGCLVYNLMPLAIAGD